MSSALRLPTSRGTRLPVVSERSILDTYDPTSDRESSICPFPSLTVPPKPSQAYAVAQTRTATNVVFGADYPNLPVCFCFRLSSTRTRFF